MELFWFWVFLIWGVIAYGSYLNKVDAEQNRSSASGRSDSGGVTKSTPTQINPKPRLKTLNEKTFGEALWLAAVAAYSGGFSPEKGSMIKTWVQREIDKLGDNRSLPFKSIAKNIMTMPPRTLITLQSPNDFRNLRTCSKNFRVDVYGLIVKIITADEQLSKQELIHLKKVEDYLDLPEEIYEKIKQQYFFGLVVNSDVSDREILTLLNIRHEWPKSKQLEYLTKEFIMWNSRSQGGPPSRRKAAIQRLSMIGRARILVQRD